MYVTAMVGSVHIGVIVGSVYVSAMYVYCIWQCVCRCSIGATLASLPDSGYWTLTTIDVHYNSTISSLDASVIYAPLDFCYHCSLPDNLTDANRSVSLAIVELQVSSCGCYSSYVYCIVHRARVFNTILCKLSVFVVAFVLP